MDHSCRGSLEEYSKPISNRLIEKHGLLLKTEGPLIVLEVFMKMTVRNVKGATFIDLIFSTAVMLLVTSSFYTLLLSFYENYGLQEAIAEMQQQVRVADDLIAREIRQTGYDPTGALFLIKKPNDAKLTKEKNNSHNAQKNQPTERKKKATPTLFHFLADLNRNG